MFVNIHKHTSLAKKLTTSQVYLFPVLNVITLDNSPEILPRNITVGNNGNLASGPHLEVAAAPSHSQASVQPRDPH